MKIKLVDRDEKKGKISFEISGCDSAYINTLRRIFMTEVPVMAIEDIEFRKNDSGLYDELVAHRLGLVPFKTDVKSYNLPAECKCKGEGCARCQLKMTLKAKGPGTVYASEIKTKDPKIKPVFPKIPIVRLLENQELELEATATLGLGKIHAKWNSCLAYYKQLAEIKIESQPENKEQVAERCPVSAFDVKNDKLILSDNASECTMCGECPHLSKGKIKVNPTDTYLMTIESWGQLEPEEIVAEAIKSYEAQLEEFTTLVAKIK
jgi:DNA-directed RNA polymerase subunit D